jgi:SAM-dependent methyltransferase
MARAWPKAQVIATDLVLPRESTVPNLTYLKHDADSHWAFEPNCFDYIHGRMLTSGIHDWPALLNKAYTHLAPGGYLELLDVCHPFRAQSSDFDAAEVSPFIKFGQLAQQSWKRSGLDYYATTKHADRMRSIGFVNVAEHAFIWPLGEWAENEREKKIGRFTISNFLRFLTTAGVAILTNGQFMAHDEAQQVVAAAQQDLEQNHDLKRFYLTMLVHTASKPLELGNEHKAG